MKPAITSGSSTKRFWLRSCLLCFLLFGIGAAWRLDSRLRLVASEQTKIEALHTAELDAGFHYLYELKFEKARKEFEAWQKSHPEDPLGSASEAAGYLGKISLKPDPKLREAFFETVKKVREVAQLRLKTTSDDTDALFAMQADYASLTDKQQLESPKLIRDADTYAKKLLMITPEVADAYLGLGTANYVIGSLPGYKRFALTLIGIHGDKTLGIQQLEVAADKDHYLRPFAKILLALAALREKGQRWPANNLQN